MVELLIKNDSIQSLYNWYCDDRFVVNRKYQRKLVWELEEKRGFINSIASSYPVPLVLLANVKKNGNDFYEIIDGMQRLEAIFSFIDNKYSIEIEGQEGFFDLETLAKTKELKDKGVLQQKKPLISRDVCMAIVEYQLPLSITSFTDKEVEEIFRRINATGKRLSNQDLRQAGATGDFSDIVRKIATNIRRDTSPNDGLPLSKMPEISLSSKGLSYGINMSDIFWVKQGIITVKNMRLSRDEELISYMLMYILLGDKVAPSAKNLDKIYGLETDESDKISNDVLVAIDKYGKREIVERFLKVFEELENILHIHGKSFNNLVFSDEYGAGVNRIFQVIFLAIYDLRTSGKIISSNEKLIQALENIGKNEFRDVSRDWNLNYRNKKIKAVKGLIDACFIEAQNVDPAIDNWIMRLETLLMQSKIEQQLFDFKIGIHSLETGKLNQKCLNKIIKTLVAMANTEKNAKGYILVGIADKPGDVEAHKKMYDSDPAVFNRFSITGVDGEIGKYYKDDDDYFNKIKQSIEKEPIDEYTKSYITRKMRLVQYHQKSVLVFMLQSDSRPLMYDNKFYERRAANNASVFEDEEISMNEMMNFMLRFK